MTGLQMELFALVGDGNSCGEWAGKTKGSGIHIPWAFPSVCHHPSPRPSSLLLLNGAVPPTLLSSVSTAVQFLYYRLLIFLLANHGFSYRKFDQSESNIVNQPLGLGDFQVPQADRRKESCLQGA